MPTHISPHKAKKILEHGEVRGHSLTEKQRKFFGAHASDKGRVLEIMKKKIKK